MYNKKFENKTYSECAQNELSDVEIEEQNSAKDDNIIDKTDNQKKNCLKTTFQPKSIFTNQNNNISFFQSNSNSYKFSSKNKSKNLNPSIDNNRNKIKVNNNKNLTNIPITTAQSFNFNYTALKRKSANQSKKKTNNKDNQIININELDTKDKKPKRTIKSYKKQFNIQKGDNFNVLSYTPNEYDSDINLNLNDKRTKKIQIYKKQEVDEIFYPSKKSLSPQSTIPKEEKIYKYQTHTLKYQSFFGSFYCTKNSRVNKSTSKLKINQLNDFNIEKLIEIGDKYANLKKAVLPLGKIMNNNIIYNIKIKKRKNKIPINSKVFNRYSCETQVVDDYLECSQKVLNQNREENKKKVAKKTISKNNLNNFRISKNNIDINKEEGESQINNTNTITKNLNFNEESDNQNSNNKKIVKLKKKYSRKNSKDFKIETENNCQQDYEYQNMQEMPKNINTTKKRSNANLSQRHNENNYDNIKVGKYNIVNRTINSNEKQNNKNVLSEPKLLTCDEKNYRSKIINQKNSQNKEILITENKKYNTNHKISLNNIHYKENPKNYYGYDERHNLEDTIDNHAYYESVHYKKKNSNLAIDKAI
jgi:hypothetical protein